MAVKLKGGRMKNLLWKEFRDGIVIFDIRQGLPTDNEFQCIVVMTDDKLVVYEVEDDGDIWDDNFILIKEIVIDENCYFYLFNFLGKLVKENTD